MTVKTLSVVIPCFNRHAIVSTCLSSIRSSSREFIQIVLVDDGSDPPLGETVTHELRNGDLLIRQENRGRAAALRTGLLAAQGTYIVIMDSDDEFVPGALDRIIGDLCDLRAQDAIGLVYPALDFETLRPTTELPENLSTTLLGLRADHGIRVDLKEVILREIVLGSLYDDPGTERRVPTSYIWAGVSECGRILTKNVPVVRHRYLPDGMSRNIKTLKRQNPYWLTQTYFRVATAPSHCYRSRWFRWKKAVQALSMDSGFLGKSQLEALRVSLGAPQYLLAKLVGFALKTATP